MHKSFIKRPICFLLSLIMIAGLYPFSIIAASSAVPMPFSAMGETKTADPSTMNDWVKYFNRQGEIFGNMLSRDVGFASNQAVYSRYARIKMEGNKCTVDLSDVDATGALSLLDHFYVSVRGQVKPDSCVGGDISIYERKKWHTNYEIKRNENSKTVSFEIL